MTERVTLRDRWENLNQRGRALCATVSFCHALGLRDRNGVWILWSSLESDERPRYIEFLKAAMQPCWHLARGPEVSLPWRPTDELLKLLDHPNRESAPVIRGSGDFLKDMGHEESDATRVRYELANRISLAVEAIAYRHVATICGITPESIAVIERGDVEGLPIPEPQRIVAKLDAEASK